MRFILTLSLCIIVAQALAAAPLSPSDAKIKGHELYEQVTLIARDGLKIQNGIPSETDQSQMFQITASLFGFLAEYQELKALDYAAIKSTGGEFASHLDRYISCELAAVSLSEFAIETSQLPVEGTSLYKKFQDHWLTCGVALDLLAARGGTRF